MCAAGGLGCLLSKVGYISQRGNRDADILYLSHATGAAGTGVDLFVAVSKRPDLAPPAKSPLEHRDIILGAVNSS